MTEQERIIKYDIPSLRAPYLRTIKLPYEMKLSWDLETTVTRMSCHKLVANNFSNTFDDLLYYYGEEFLEELGINIFGGCYNYRKMRGGDKLSMHSWGLAIDLNPVENGLRTKWKYAQFSQPEYKPMIDIFYANGFINLGLEHNFDAMHFEIKD